MEGTNLGPTTDVRVMVTGDFTLPLHLAALESLEDPILQEEIVKEATRIALAERLGGFDRADVAVVRRHGAPTCEARVDLASLACAIADIQHAYDHIIQHVEKMQEIINEAQKRTKTKKEEGEEIADGVDTCLEALAVLVKDAFAAPCGAPLAEEVRRANNKTAASDHFDDGVPCNGLDDGYEPLLDQGDDDDDDVNEHHAGYHKID